MVEHATENRSGCWFESSHPSQYEGMKNMKVIKTNDTIHLYRDDVETYDRIPVGTYTICFAKNVG